MIEREGSKNGCNTEYILNEWPLLIFNKLNIANSVVILAAELLWHSHPPLLGAGLGLGFWLSFWYLYNSCLKILEFILIVERMMLLVVSGVGDGSRRWMNRWREMAVSENVSRCCRLLFSSCGVELRKEKGEKDWSPLFFYFFRVHMAVFTRKCAFLKI